MFKWLKEITPSQVIKLMIAEKDKEKLISVFDSATAEYANGFLHDQRSFGYTVSRLVSANKIKAAEDRIARMKTENCADSEDVLLLISRGYGRVHMPFDSLRILTVILPTRVTLLFLRFSWKRIRCDLDSYTYGTLISGFCRFGRIDQAKKLFEMMVERDCLPVTYTSMIHYLCGSMNVEEALRYLE
ncbi:hypothetical protein HID58_006815 [Brassica napus]|uniref:Pentatricopeptide repeat-containing protein n=1 Tax=Brassica napus TaxID=3708 RepID=A0ABQ8ECK6_BRANA|nr:hypothetical protein HID58_007932 [Brassica napus]KAH0939354.1 hypothetical protein HID58_006815 [Brassica napus]